MRTSTNEAEAELTCLRCECGIDCCAFCDKERCAAAICYGCMIVELDDGAQRSPEHGRLA